MHVGEQCGGVVAMTAQASHVKLGRGSRKGVEERRTDGRSEQSEGTLRSSRFKSSSLSFSLNRLNQKHWEFWSFHSDEDTQGTSAGATDSDGKRLRLNYVSLKK